MASNSSTRSGSPADIDFSVISTSLQMGHKMIDQILHGIHYGSKEARQLLREECDFIMECKVCRNLFRSFPNFVAHKRVYCIESIEEKIEKEKFTPSSVEEETVVIQPEDPLDTIYPAVNIEIAKQSSLVNSKNTVINKVVDRTFEGKSKGYQFYTKVAEHVVKKKASRLTNTVTLTTIATNPNAVIVSHAKGDMSSESPVNSQKSSPKKQSPPRNTSDKHQGSNRYDSPKKNTLTDLCAKLACKKAQECIAPSEMATESVNVASFSARSRKSAPKKAIEFIGMKEQKKGRQEKQSKSVALNTTDSDIEEWINDSADLRKVARLSGNDNIVDKSWMEICDLEKLICKKCNKRFSALHSLKFHAKLKHGGSLVQYPCFECEKTFSHFTSLVRHMRTTHHKLESFIEEMRTNQKKYQRIVTGNEKTADDAGLKGNLSTSEEQEGKISKRKRFVPGRKSFEQMEIDEAETSESAHLNPQPSSQKVSWKKCDKCGKVFWKAKSYNKHYNTCKGSGKPVKPADGSKKNNGNDVRANVGSAKDNMSKNKSNVTETISSLSSKTGHEESTVGRAVANVDAKRAEALSNLQEKLIVENKAFINDGSKACDSSKNKMETVTVGPMTVPYGTRLSSANQKKSQVEETSMYKPLTQEMEMRTVDAARKHIHKLMDQDPALNTKTRHPPIKSEHKKDPIDKNMAIPTRTRPQVVQPAQDQPSTAVTPATPVVTEGNVKVYSTRHSTQSIKTFDGIGDEQNKQKCIEQSLPSKSDGKMQTPSVDFIPTKEAVELKKLQDRLTLAALGKTSSMEQIEELKKDTNNKVKSVTAGKVKSYMGTKSPNIVEEPDGVIQDKVNYSETTPDKHFRTNPSLNLFRSVSPIGVSRSVSPTGVSQPSRLVSPTRVSQPTSYSSFPNSPTSLNSNSNDGYNSKFRMTVKEMAELVESASLTKFAKERKKKASNILNNKQNKHNLGASLAKPMKRRVKKKNVVVPKVYRTRFSTGSVNDEKDNQMQEDRRKYRTRFSTVKGSETDTDITKEIRYKTEQKASEVQSSAEETRVFSRIEIRGPGWTSHNKVTNKETSKVHIAVKPKPRSSSETNRKSTSSHNVPKEGFNLRTSRDHSQCESLSKDAEPKSSKDSTKVRGIESQTENNRLDREMKRLGHSADPVESHLYSLGDSLSSFRDASKEIPSEEQTEKKRQSREMKRLENSAGLVESKLYAMHSVVSTSRDSSKEKKVDEHKKYPSREIKRLDNSARPVESEVYTVNDQVSKSPKERYEEPLDKKLFSREMKRLANSEGLVEDKLYLVTDSLARNTSKDQQNEVESKRLSRQRRRPEHLIDFVDTGSSRESSRERSVSTRLIIRSGTNPDNESKAMSATTVNSLRQKMLAARRSLNNRKNIMYKQSPIKSGSASSKLKSPPNRKGIAIQETKAESESEVDHMKEISLNDKEKEIKTKVVKHEHHMIKAVNENKNCIIEENKDTDTDEIAENQPLDERSHRTRLATGSIFFDSELLKMSPFKAEKRALTLRNTGIDQGNKTKERIQENKESDQPSSMPACRRLSLSPKTSSPIKEKIHKRSKSGPQRFALTTGVKQCQKCLKTFWKLKSFRCHMMTSACKNETITKGKQTKLGKKRVLPQSPEKPFSITTDYDSKNTTKVKKARIELKEKCFVQQEKRSDLKNIYILHKEKMLNKKTDLPLKETQELFELAKENGSPVKTLTNTVIGLETKLNESVEKGLDNLKASLTKTVEKGHHNLSTDIEGKVFHVKLMTDQQPGTSASFLGNGSDDECTSEFSGFSEDDLKGRDIDTSNIDFSDDDDDDESDEICFEDSDDADNDMLISDGGKDTDLKEIAKTVKKISNLDEVGYVEEIWIDKQPGMPAVEKIKNIKNRSYVVDAENPLKLHCHNIKHVDKLIDENNLKCLQCETSCTSISNLRRHVIRHLGWKRYKCKVCVTFACYDVSECRLHLIRTHNEHLTNRNFFQLVCDLKKEATKKRNAKRMNTIRNRRQRMKINGEETYKKPRQIVVVKCSNQGSVEDELLNESSVESVEIMVTGSYKTNNKQKTGNFDIGQNGDIDENVSDNTVSKSHRLALKEGLTKIIPAAITIESSIEKKSDKTPKKENVELTEKEDPEASQLLKARLNLVQALK